MSAGPRSAGRLPLDLALRALENLEHRGGRLPDGSGDGAGLLLELPRAFLAREMHRLVPGVDAPFASEQRWALATLFLPPDLELGRVQEVTERVLDPLGLDAMAWRKVPLDLGPLGLTAREGAPEVVQIGLQWRDTPPAESVRRRLFGAQRDLSDAFSLEGLPVYLASFSNRTTLYKGMMDGAQIAQAYPDLRAADFISGTVVFHRRFATNTEANWRMCQPFRLLCHNGEINTIAGNRQAMRMWDAYLREARKTGEGWPEQAFVAGRSDSADLDSAVQAYHAEGRSLAYTMAALMPPSWENRQRNRSLERRALFEFLKRAMGSLGSWEGPAAVISYDGDQLVATLDRMGLRPLRVVRSEDGLVLISSEGGVLERDPDTAVQRRQLGPGSMVLYDTRNDRLLKSSSAYFEILREAAPPLDVPFRELNHRQLREPMAYGPRTEVPHPDLECFGRRDGAFLRAWGWESRQRQRSTDHLIDLGKEEILSLGNDRAQPCLSVEAPPLYRFFFQRFAQVTNPPIDAYREGKDVSLVTYLGRQPDVPPRVSPDAPSLRLRSPVLTGRTIDEILAAADLSPRRLDLTFPARGNGAAIAAAVESLCDQAVAAVRKGSAVLVLSDRGCFAARRWPLPAPLAVSAIGERLTEAGLRTQCTIVVESGEVSEGHDLAVLVGLGADAVHPHALFTYAVLRALRQGRPTEAAVRNVQSGLEESLRRIMSKMGIPSVQGYRDACLFEAVGLGLDVMQFVPRVPSRVGGLTLDDVANDLARRVRHAMVLERLPHIDFDARAYSERVRIALWNVACSGDDEDWERYVRLADGRRPTALRDLVTVADPEDVEPMEPAGAEDVLRSMVTTGGMSRGALTSIAHEVIAEAANRIGMLSNSGEGGERRDRNRGGPRAHLRSRIRQVATGRFGVDAEYLVNADEIQIKMAQGAKPGEGGQLMAAKVTPEIAALRYCRPGIDLISPPPHHDIYSIEDLKQLIHDLRGVNPDAQVSVKLCAVTGIGTIAAGVVKAGADLIEIDGLEGGTAAAPLTSIEHAGLPSELGLAETHHALCELGLRSLVRLRAGGGIRTAADALKLVLLGADQISIATPLMIAQGCVHCTSCHTGRCPSLIAGELNPKAVHPGSAEHVERFLLTFGRALAALAARHGARHPAELVGRANLLRRRSDDELRAALPEAYGFDPDVFIARARTLNLDVLLCPAEERRRFGDAGRMRNIDQTPRDTMASDPELLSAVEEGRALERTFRLHSRTSIDFGVWLAGRMARRWGRDGWPSDNDTITLSTTGTAGQSYGAFCVRGLRLNHVGSCNDGVAKGMSGGTMAIRQALGFQGRAWETILVGNAVAFGATGGRLFVEGRAGQRLAVRNSGATIVCEGAGQYACEYMTGGVVVLLGRPGESLGAGMTDGRVYVFVPEAEDDLRFAVDPSSVVVTEPTEEELYGELLPLLDAYVAATDSERGRAARQNLHEFRKVIPTAVMVEQMRAQLELELRETIAG